MPIAPGPGSAATPSTATLPVFGMQNTEAIAETCAAPSLRFPAGVPVSLMQSAVGLPKAPALASVCPTEAQMRPSVAVCEAVPVVSGVRLTGSCAWKPASGGRQSSVVSRVPTPLHAEPLSSPGEPFTSV
jgi:hypothetical protein